MLTHPTLDQMQALGLAGMATAYRELAAQNSSSDLSRDEWLGLMLDREASIRADKRLTNRLAVARLRFADACIENIDFAAVEATVGASTAEALRRVTLAVYTRAEGLARSRGLLLADTKFEFGRTSDKPDELVLADEVLTPDSSRWWPVESYEPGRAQPSFDKQFVRDWLTSPASGWDKNSGEQPPQLPDEIVDRTRAKYIEAYERLTGRSWK